jgi:hypothetical protein
LSRLGVAKRAPPLEAPEQHPPAIRGHAHFVRIVRTDGEIDEIGERVRDLMPLPVPAEQATKIARVRTRAKPPQGLSRVSVTSSTSSTSTTGPLASLMREAERAAYPSEMMGSLVLFAEQR